VTSGISKDAGTVMKYSTDISSIVHMPITFKNAEILLYKNRQKEIAEGQSKPKYHCGKCVNRQKKKHDKCKEL
jgi:hypothetical protein